MKEINMIEYFNDMAASVANVYATVNSTSENISEIGAGIKQVYDENGIYTHDDVSKTLDVLVDKLGDVIKMIDGLIIDVKLIKDSLSYGTIASFKEYIKYLIEAKLRRDGKNIPCDTSKMDFRPEVTNKQYVTIEYDPEKFLFKLAPMTEMTDYLLQNILDMPISTTMVDDFNAAFTSQMEFIIEHLKKITRDFSEVSTRITDNYANGGIAPNSENSNSSAITNAIVVTSDIIIRFSGYNGDAVNINGRLLNVTQLLQNAYQAVRSFGINMEIYETAVKAYCDSSNTLYTI